MHVPRAAGTIPPEILTNQSLKGVNLSHNSLGGELIGFDILGDCKTSVCPQHGAPRFDEMNEVLILQLHYFLMLVRIGASFLPAPVVEMKSIGRLYCSC